MSIKVLLILNSEAYVSESLENTEEMFPRLYVQFCVTHPSLHFSHTDSDYNNHSGIHSLFTDSYLRDIYLRLSIMKYKCIKKTLKKCLNERINN